MIITMIMVKIMIRIMRVIMVNLMLMAKVLIIERRSRYVMLPW